MKKQTVTIKKRKIVPIETANKSILSHFSNVKSTRN